MKISSEKKLSVCMIVRDECRVLQRCIDSLGGLFHELCIVDTGSVDETINIALRNGAAVECFSECNDADGNINDFAMARNRALQMASGDWILQIDADEVLQCGLERIVGHINNVSIGQIGVLMSSDGAHWVSTRIFRNIEGLHYQSRIHEYLAHGGVFLADKSIVIKNLPDKRDKESASDRNIRLCKLALTDEPKNGRLHHYLGNEYRKLRMFKEAIKAYETSLACADFKVGIYHTAYYLGVSYLLVEDWDRALKAAFECLHIDPRYAEAPCLLGDIYSSIGQTLHAIQWYKTALSKTPPYDAVMAIQYWTYDEHPKSQLQKLKSSLAKRESGI